MSLFATLSWKTLVYPFFGLMILGGYSYYVFTPSEFGADRFESVSLPPNAIGADGQITVAPSFWARGFHGGK